MTINLLSTVLAFHCFETGYTQPYHWGVKSGHAPTPNWFLMGWGVGLGFLLSQDGFCGVCHGDVGAGHHHNVFKN